MAEIDEPVEPLGETALERWIETSMTQLRKTMTPGPGGEPRFAKMRRIYGVRERPAGDAMTVEQLPAGVDTPIRAPTPTPAVAGAPATTTAEEQGPERKRIAQQPGTDADAEFERGLELLVAGLRHTSCS